MPDGRVRSPQAPHSLQAASLEHPNALSYEARAACAAHPPTKLAGGNAGGCTGDGYGGGLGGEGGGLGEIGLDVGGLDGGLDMGGLDVDGAARGASAGGGEEAERGVAGLAELDGEAAVAEEDP